MLSKGGHAGAEVLAQVFRSIAFEANNILSATAVVDSAPRASPVSAPTAERLYAAVRTLTTERLAALTSIARDCQVSKRATLCRRDPLVSAGVRTLCSFPAASTTSTTANTSYHVTATTTKSATFHTPIPPQDLVPRLQALVLAGAHHDPQLAELSEAAAVAMPHLTPQQISDLAVGFAQLGYFNTRFKSRAADEIANRLSEFTPAALANAAWAFGELQYMDCILMTALVPHIQANCDQFSATDLAKVLWVFARVGYRDDALPDIMSAMAAKMDTDFCPKTLSEVVFATAQLGCAELEVVEALAGHALENLPSYDPESLGKMTFGLASCGLDDPELFEAVAERAMEALPDMRPVDVARVLWALSQIGHYHKGLLDRVTETLPTTMKFYDRDELKMLIQACNKLGCTTKSVADAAQLMQQREEQLPEELVGTPVPAASW